jgi:hypothetical protein
MAMTNNTSHLQLNTNYNFMKYLGFDGWKEAIFKSFQWKLVSAIWLQLVLCGFILIAVQYYGMEKTHVLLETWLFKPMSSLWVLMGAITADWLSGSYRGYKTKEGFITRKATQIGGKVFFNVLFFGILFNVTEHMIKPIVPDAVDLNKILIAIILMLASTHMLSLGKNLAIVGLMPKPFIHWFSTKIDKYKEKLNDIV